MNTDSFIVHLNTDNIYKHISKDVEITFDTSNFELDRSLPKGKNKSDERWISWANHEKIVGLIAKTHSYLKENNDKNKKAKGRKKCVTKRKLRFKDYKNKKQLKLKWNKPFRKK